MICARALAPGTPGRRAPPPRSGFDRTPRGYQVKRPRTCTRRESALQLRSRLQPKSPRAPIEGTAGEALGPAPPDAVVRSQLGVAEEASSTLTTEEWERL